MECMCGYHFTIIDIQSKVGNHESRTQTLLLLQISWSCGFIKSRTLLFNVFFQLFEVTRWHVWCRWAAFDVHTSSFCSYSYIAEYKTRIVLKLTNWQLLFTVWFGLWLVHLSVVICSTNCWLILRVYISKKCFW